MMAPSAPSARMDTCWRAQPRAPRASRASACPATSAPEWAARPAHSVRSAPVPQARWWAGPGPPRRGATPAGGSREPLQGRLSAAAGLRRPPSGLLSVTLAPPLRHVRPPADTRACDKCDDSYVLDVAAEQCVEVSQRMPAHAACCGTVAPGLLAPRRGRRADGGAATHTPLPSTPPRPCARSTLRSRHALAASRCCAAGPGCLLPGVRAARGGAGHGQAGPRVPQVRAVRARLRPVCRRAVPPVHRGLRGVVSRGRRGVL